VFVSTVYLSLFSDNNAKRYNHLWAIAHDNHPEEPLAATSWH